MNARVRDARLRGTMEAARLHQTLEIRERFLSTGAQIDVFGALAELDIIVLFKPLDGLLGAYLRGDAPGALISTRRPQSVQRFTGAHELGHAVLNHTPSLDSSGVLRRAAEGYANVRSAAFGAQLQEIEADAFASEFLTPAWLLLHHARVQGWKRSDLAEPDVAYQMALRCGGSYEATLRSLGRNRFIGEAEVERARQIKPKALKAKIKDGTDAASPWADTWLLTERDERATLPIASGDLIRVQLTQASDAGYLWSLAPLDQERLILAKETVELPPQGEIGPSTKNFFLRTQNAGDTAIELIESRPWLPGQRDLSLRLSVRDAEKGLARANRARLHG